MLETGARLRISVGGTKPRIEIMVTQTINESKSGKDYKDGVRDFQVGERPQPFYFSICLQ